MNARSRYLLNTSALVVSQARANLSFSACSGVVVLSSESSTLHVMAVLMFVLFMLLVAIVYLNLLVAMMTSGYTKVTDTMFLGSL